MLDRTEAIGASGPVVVVDVLRAFTTAAWAFAGGALKIVLVGELADAWAAREVHPDWLLVGEVGGQPVEGFDLSNSPVEMRDAGADGALFGRTLVQRTSAGTQGVVAVAPTAERIWCAGLVTARATAASLGVDSTPTYVITGRGAYGQGGGDGDEDAAAAELIEALRTAPDPAAVDVAPYVERVERSLAAVRIHRRAAAGVPGAHHGDVDLAAQVDRFDFALEVLRAGRRLELLAAPVDAPPAGNLAPS